MILYSARLAAAVSILVLAVRHFLVPKAALGIRLSSLVSDLRWSIECCLLGALVIAAMMVVGLAVARLLQMRLPAPPELILNLLQPDNWSMRHFITLMGVGANAVLLAPLTEELIYRSVLLPTWTARFGLYPAAVVTSVVFGLVHVVPLGVVGVPAPQMLGGLMMAAAFSIRWSVVPAIVLHGLGNLFVGILLVVYVRLFEACPTWFLSR
jgi:hypothetical protein